MAPPETPSAKGSSARPACRVRQLREERGLSQVDLAERIGLSRQSLSGIEAGQVDPSVSTALKLAGALQCRVEDLFSTSDEPTVIEAELAADSARDELPARVRLVRVGGRLIAHPLPARGGSSQAADGVLRGPARRSRRLVEVELLGSSAEVGASIAMAGCAAALGVLVERAAEASGIKAAWVRMSSTASMQALNAGWAHIAGVHFTDGREGTNDRSVREQLGADPVLLINLAVWEEGFVVARGNPKSIRASEDLLRPDVSLAAREPGAAARTLLEALVRRAGGSLRQVLQGALGTTSHEETALAVAFGSADVGIATRASALALDLGFVPQVEERFDLVVPVRKAQERDVERLLSVLRSKSYHRELGALGGHDTHRTGHLMAELSRARSA